MKLTIVAATFLISSFAYAQHAHHHPPQTNAPAGARASAYAGLQARPIKALSAQQIEDLRAGKGISLALPAELNGYPGPAHVLELADQLRLSEAQRTKTQRLFEEMKTETAQLGEQLIAAEVSLDRLFHEKRATVALVEEASANAARIHGALRAAHLRYHLHMANVLEPAQIKEYEKLRGYR